MDRQDPDLVEYTRTHMWEIIDKNGSPKTMARCGEIIGYLGDTRDLKAFIAIPGGTYKLEELGKAHLDPFEIGQYPVTNHWFAQFVHAKGYETPSFWSKEGLKWLKASKVTQPRYWEERRWRCPNHPVVGVSWYEADAFVRWLNRTAKNGHTYFLPTEYQWQAAAAGHDNRPYPWGEGWGQTM